VRGVLAAWLLSLAILMLSAAAGAAEPLTEIRLLDPSAAGANDAQAITHGRLDSHFGPFDLHETRRRGGPFWLQIRASQDFILTDNVPTLTIRKGRHLHTQLYVAQRDQNIPLPAAITIPGFRGVQDAVHVLPEGLQAGQSLYVRVEPRGRGSEELAFSTAALNEVLSGATEHSRMIALTFGALMSMALAALLIWFILSDKLLILYATLFSLQAIYIAYLSGQGFDWPLLSFAQPLTSYTWNVPAALSGAIACLFVREIADLKHFSPRVYNAFGWLAVAFVVLMFANAARLVGLGEIVSAIGNLVFLGAALFTLIVAFLSWRRHNRAAGWFLIAWGLLEGFTIATAMHLLLTDPGDADNLMYYGLPLSMVAAAVLIALGVADRLRAQRLALTDAERRAQIDALTGVLNRRSLIERLDSTCVRARARGLPTALLFIDLDHFKKINDTYGHAAGDACLRAVIGPIQAELRQSDVIGRYGGEEFVVILSSADAAAAHPIAERILKRVADIAVEGFGEPIHLTCSIGVAASDTLGVWGENLIAQADAAVYAAKRSGRNRVQIAEALAA